MRHGEKQPLFKRTLSNIGFDEKSPKYLQASKLVRMEDSHATAESSIFFASLPSFGYNAPAGTPWKTGKLEKRLKIDGTAKIRYCHPETALARPYQGPKSF